MSQQKGKVKLDFPKGFLWGAASSGHQVEGGNNDQWSAWELENAKVLSSQAPYQSKYLPKWELIKSQAQSPENYVSAGGTGHYKNYKQDIELLKELNMNVWRFSIEWSRIEPEEGKWNAEAIEHYRTYLKDLKDAGIEPMVTLWHWTHPVWFEEKGGFTKRRNIKYFVRYAEKILEELGRDFKYVITINEPETYVAKGFILSEWPPQKSSRMLGVWTLFNLLSAHKKVYKVAKKTGRKYQISFAKVTAHNKAGDDALITRWAVEISDWATSHLLLNFVKKQLDFIGLNYYFTNRFYGYRIHNPQTPVNDLGWYMDPAGIEPVLKDLYDRYNLPIIITENGLADAEDEHRKWWISMTILAINRAIKQGVKVDGYLHWSLTDNFEWSSGFWPRFGLAEMDYKTGKRKLRASAIWFGKFIGSIRK